MKNSLPLAFATELPYFLCAAWPGTYILALGILGLLAVRLWYGLGPLRGC